MAASDFLKKFRKEDSGDTGGEKPSLGKPEESGEKMSRELKLTGDEMKAFADAQPGQDLACEVHGTLEGDGRFRVMSVSPVGGGESYGGPDENGMAQAIAQRVSPGMQPA